MWCVQLADDLANDIEKVKFTVPDIQLDESSVVNVKDMNLLLFEFYLALHQFVKFGDHLPR